MTNLRRLGTKKVSYNKTTLSRYNCSNPYKSHHTGVCLSRYNYVYRLSSSDDKL